jgi:glucuronate isomerase
MRVPEFQELYERHRDLPIIDYHGHLSPERIADNRPFENLAELWIDGDHYKWRAVRIAGETDISPTGTASPREKFHSFVRALRKNPGNPLQTWVRMELSQGFGIDAPLTPSTADEIWDRTRELLQCPGFRPREILAKVKVQAVCTTDDPADSLDAHRAFMAEDDRSLAMYPSFRPDAAFHLGSAAQFEDWLSRLEAASGVSVTGFSSLLLALRQRFDMFHELGCRVSDHGLEHAYPTTCSDAEADVIFRKLRQGKAGHDDMDRWRGRLLHEFAEWDTDRGWTMLLHLGARRNINRRVASRLGLDAGCDAIGDYAQGEPLVAFLDSLDSSSSLPRTILFNSHPRDTLMFATIAGSYFEEGVPGKVQVGPPWWFLDQRFGIVDYLDLVSSVGALGVMAGMVTDSRSFLSIYRHDYFRRVVTEYFIAGMRAGTVNPEQTDIDALFRGVFYENARDFFGWDFQ